MCVTEVRQIVRQHGVGKAARRGKADNSFGASIPAGNAPIDRLELSCAQLVELLEKGWVFAHDAEHYSAAHGKEGAAFENLNLDAVFEHVGGRGHGDIGGACFCEELAASEREAGLDRGLIDRAGDDIGGAHLECRSGRPGSANAAAKADADLVSIETVSLADFPAGLNQRGEERPGGAVVGMPAAIGFGGDVDGLSEEIDSIGWVWPNQDDRGAHVNLATASMTAAAPNPENAVKFLEFLTSDFAQSHFASQNNEYPAVQGAPGVEAKDRLGDFKADDTTPTAAFSRNAKAAQTIFNEVGWD